MSECQHNYKLIIHLDFVDHALWTYRCEFCEDIQTRKIERDEHEKGYWSE